MKQEGAYRLLEGEDLEDISSGYTLSELDDRLESVEVLDSRVSTLHTESSAYNGALLIKSDGKISLNEGEEIEDTLAQLGPEIDRQRICLMYETRNYSNAFYSIVDTGRSFDL